MIRDVGTSAERAGEVGPIEEIKIAAEYALDSPFPDQNDLYTDVN